LAQLEDEAEINCMRRRFRLMSHHRKGTGEENQRNAWMENQKLKCRQKNNGS